MDSFVTCESCGGGVPLRATGRPRVHAFCEKPECQRACAVVKMRLSRAGKRCTPLEPPLPQHVRTVHGSNSQLIAAVAKLYVPDGAVVVDLTWGLGAFWKRFGGRRRFTLIGSDIRERAGLSMRADFRQLPYGNESVDVAVLDPPYVHDHGSHMAYARGRYGGNETGSMSHAGIMRLYQAGMAEALRVLRPGGTLWVKCQDEVQSGKQCWSHIEIRGIAGDLGLSTKDLFILVGTPRATRRHLRQQHARKTHSYLWIFERH